MTLTSVPRSTREQSEERQGNEFIVDDCSPEQRAYEKTLPLTEIKELF